MSRTAPAPSTFLREPPAFPFCSGCGYRPYVEALDRALVRLDLDPSKVAVVSDVGCIGAACDVLMAPHVVRAMNGRSIAFAAGLELADSILHDSALKTVVVVGDGGAMVGLQHILAAARMNLDLTVLVANNAILGLSGGQPSALCASVEDGPADAMVPTLDLCGLVRECGGGFVARVASKDGKLAEAVAQAIDHPGFALVEVLVDCLAGTDDQAHPADWSRLPLGSHTTTVTRPDFGTSYRRKAAASAAGHEAGTFVPHGPGSPVRRPMRWLIAGSAGEQVHWAASVLARAGAMTGSHVTQNDAGGPRPGNGLAMSEVCVSRDPIGHTGADVPDVVVAVSQDALDEVRASGILGRATEACLLVMDDSLPPVDTDADTLRAPFRAACTPERAAMAAVLLANRRRRSMADQRMFAAIKLDRPNEVSRYKKDLAQLLAALG